jgi:hypothetical protein
MSEGSFDDAGALGDVFPGNCNAKISGRLQCCVYNVSLSVHSVPTFILCATASQIKIIKLLIFEFYWDPLNTDETLLWSG